MAVSLLGPFNKIINDTATQIVDSELLGKVSGVIATFVKSSLGAVDDLLKQVQDLTKEEPEPAAKTKSKKPEP